MSLQSKERWYNFSRRLLIKGEIMSFNYFDIMQIGMTLIICYLGYIFYTKEMYKSLVATGLAVVVVLFTSPVVMETPSNSRFTSTPTPLPEKVVVESVSFEEKQVQKLEKLKQESNPIDPSFLFL